MNGRVIRLESHRGVVHYFKGETQAAIKLLEKHLESLYIKKWTPEYLFLCYLKVRNFKAAKKLIVYATRRFSRSMGERFGKQLAEAQQEKN